MSNLPQLAKCPRCRNGQMMRNSYFNDEVNCIQCGYIIYKEVYIEQKEAEKEITDFNAKFTKNRLNPAYKE